MRLALILCLALVAAPVRAQEAPNLSDAAPAGRGAAAQLVLAQESYASALAAGEALPLIAAIRLARGVTLRPATGWERVTAGEPVADAPAGLAQPPDPAGEEALTIARNLAGDDPDLQDMVYDLDAQVPRGRSLTAVEVRADLAPGQTDEWRLPLFGEVAAEIALIGDGDAPLALTLRDEGGADLCLRPASTRAQLCSLTPARNGFFTVSVRNAGSAVVSYRLVGN